MLTEDTRVHPGDVGRLGFGKMSISLACDHILEVIFSYLELSELRNCALVCHRGITCCVTKTTTSGVCTASGGLPRRL
jgi:F-box-like